MRRVDLFRDRTNKTADGLHGQSERGEKKANGHSVQACITMFQDPNKRMNILTENITILKETLEKIEQLAGKLTLSPAIAEQESTQPL